MMLPRMNPLIQGKRLLSLDAFRGVAIAGMILVNDPGDWSYVYPQLKHADWNGCTFADWIYPFFLFIVGAAMTYSFAHRKERGDTDSKLILQVVRRSFILFVLGLLMHGFPYYHLSTIRIPGTLQRIGICYLVASVIILKTSIRAQVYWIAGLLGSYWLMMQFVPVPGIGPGVYEPGKNFAAYIDSLVLSGHMWQQHPTWDPEGIVSTLPAIATTLFGVLTGHWLRSSHSHVEKTAWMFVAGFLLLFLGLILDMWLPINKSIWTSSYSVFTAGWALICLAMFYWLIDVKGYKRWAAPLVIYGMNAIAAYVGDGAVGKILTMIHWSQINGADIDLRTYAFQNLYLRVASPINASLLFAVTYASVLFLMTLIMWKKRWFLKV